MQHPVGGAATFLSPEVGVVVHCHLRWDFVWQRPQQILSRIAGTNPVLFVEEPLFLDDIDRPRLDLTTPYPGLTRAVPHLPRESGDQYDEAIASVRTLVEAAVRSPDLAPSFQRVAQWFYTPMAAPEMLGALGEECVVYDCMDELSQFRYAPTDLVRRERLLLSRADVVFTGGYRLYESKSRYHANVHFFGCGVDAAHFGRAREEETLVPEDARDLPRPVLGYFGVIDERLDYELLRDLAEARPDATLLMIGPVVKVDPRELPQAPNIRWLGQRDYKQLPAYVKSFDVCLMPFALNEATEYINPTKTLEYMAAGKPIVSTAVADVVRNFTPIVRVARSSEEFVAAVSGAAERPEGELIHAGIQRASEASWDATVERIRGLVADAIESRFESDALEVGLGDVLTVDRHDAMDEGLSADVAGRGGRDTELGRGMAAGD